MLPLPSWRRHSLNPLLSLGTVTDPSGATIQGASVTLTNLRTGVSQKGKTDSGGNFLFVNQRLGSYTVRAEMTGFKAEETSAFDLAVDARQRVDLKLKIGKASESVRSPTQLN